MADLTLRLAKGSPLTNAEVDANFSSLNTAKIEADDTRTLTNKVIDSISNTVGADHIHFKVKATEAIAKGQVVRAVGFNAGENALEVALVTSAAHVAIGVSHDTLLAGAFGAVVNTGLLENFDTSAFAVGTILYPNTSGGFTATQPSAGTYQAIAFVVRSHATHGTVLVEASEPAAVRTSSNVGNTVVLRDASGNFSANTITATSFSGSASGLTGLRTINGNSILGSGDIQIDGGVTSFNTRTGAITLTSGDVTGALGFTPYNITNPSGYITSAALSSYLPLSGGTVTGDLFVQGGGSRFPAHFFHYEYDSSGSVYEHFYTPGSENVKNSSANLRVSSTSGYYKTLRFSGDGSLSWNGSEVLTTSNYTSYSPSLTGSGASGTWGINVTGTSSYSTTSGSASTATRSTIEDTRAAQRTPNEYDDYRASYEFTDQITGIGDWHTAFTMQGWHNGYAAWQIIGPASTGAHENWYLRSGVNTSWNPPRTILHSGNYGSYSSFSGAVTSGGNTGFRNDVYYGGVRNPIWSFGNAGAYGISYFQGAAGIGGTDTIGIHPNGTPTSGGSSFSVTPAASYVNSNVVLHAGNYNSYALPLSGGTTSGYIRVAADWASGVHNEQLTVRGTYASIALRNTTNNGQVWLVHNDGNFNLYGVNDGNPDSNSWTNRFRLTNAGQLDLSGNIVLHAGNYNSYAPTLTGGGASGTWGINITGNAASVSGISAPQFFNNMGNNHTTYTDANSIPGFGFYYLQGTTNGPGNGNTQWYGMTLGLGNDYAYGSYAMQFAIPRTPSAGNPYPAVRFRENGSWGSWSKIWAGYADTAGSATDSTKLPLSGGTVTGVLIGNGGFANVDGGIRIANPGGASYATTASTVTGAIKIRLPAAALGSNTMLSFRVRVYQYSGGLTQEFVIAGYNYGDASATWYNVSALSLSDTGSDFTVRFGKDGTSQCVYIGELGSTWSYPQVHVVDFCGGYSGMAASTWATGWNISFETSAFAGVTNSRTAWRSLHAGNVGSYAHTVSSDPSTSGPGVLAIGNQGSYSFVQSHGGQPLNLNPLGNTVQITGNVALHAGNYSSYALPLNGGTVSGNLGLGVAPDLRLCVNGETHISSYLYMGGTAGSYSSWGSRDYTTSGNRYINASYFEVNNYGYGSTWSFAVDGSSSRYNGNVLLHAGNYTSYALPLSGGTVSGSTTFNNSVIVNGRDIRPFENDSYKEFYVGGDANTYYPVLFGVYAWFHFARWSISRGYGDTAPWDPIGTGAHKGGLTLTWEWSGDGAWGGNDHTIRVIQFAEQYTTMVGGMALSVNGLIVWLRGGNAYYRFHGPGGTMNGATPYYSTFTAANGSTYSPRSYDSGTVASEVTSRMPVRGVSELYDGGNRVLHLGNYGSYALPLSGGTITGNIVAANNNVGGVFGNLEIGYGGRYNTLQTKTSADTAWIQYAHAGPVGLAYGGGATTAYGTFNSVGALTQNGNQVLHAGNYSSYALPLSGGTLSDDIAFSNGRKGLVGVYDASQTQAIFAMGSSYKLQDGGSSSNYGNFYGLGWSYNPDYGGAGNNPQSKAGLSHQLLLMMAGTTRTAIGTGIWTDGTITATGGVAASGAITQGGNQVLHAGNYTSYSPSLTGSGASGTWGISVSGSAASATSAVRLVFDDGPRDLSNRLPNSFARTVNFDFVGAGTGNGTGNYAGVMTFSPWSGTTASTGDSSYQLAFANTSGVNASGQPKLSIRNGIDSTWNAWYTLLHSGNYNSYALPLSGGTVTGRVVLTNDGQGGGSESLHVTGDIRAQRGTGSTGVIYFGSSSGTYLYYDGANYHMPGGQLDVGGNRVLTAGNYTSYPPAYAPLLSAVGNYTFSAATNGRDFSTGVQAGFVSSGQGYPSYGSIVRIKTYSNDGGTAELYFPYSSTYGGSAMCYRLGQYDNAGWTGWKTVLDSSNYTSYSPSLTGSGASGTWGISVTGSASSLSGFTNSNSGNPIAGADAQTNNGIGYVTSISLLGQTDGALYTQAYSSSWVHQVYGDYRTGQLAIRGRNSGTWQAWRTVLDSSNYSSYAPALTGLTKFTGAILRLRYSYPNQDQIQSNNAGIDINASDASYPGIRISASGAGSDPLTFWTKASSQPITFRNYDTNGEYGYIWINSNGTTSYATSSDYRLKNIDGEISEEDSGAFIDGLLPKYGTWKSDGSVFVGFVAHEVQVVAKTEIATGPKDGPRMQAIDYSSPELIANLVAQVKFLRARVEELEGKINS